MTTSAAARESLRDLLLDAHEKVLLLRRRQFSLEAFIEELNRVSRLETFDIHNDLRWLHVLDMRDKNVIDFASWAKGAYSKGGMFGALCAHHLAAFPAKRAWGQDGERDEARDAAYTAKRKRLFGEGVGAALKPADVNVLHTAFSTLFEPLVKDRHENRAHIYERGGTGLATMLDVSETAALYDYAQTVLADLALVGLGAGIGVTNLSNASVTDDAKDLIDDILLPRHARQKIEPADVDRDGFYAKLHEIPHDAGGKPAFNHRDTVYRVMTDLGMARRTPDGTDSLARTAHPRASSTP